MLEILKKIASIALDVQHVQRSSNILYSNPNISAENISKLCTDIGTSLDDIITETNLIKGLMSSSVNVKKD